MMPGFDESFGMGHQAEDPAGRIAEAGDGPRRAVGIGRIILGRVAVSVGIFQDDLSGAVERFECSGFAVTNRPSPWATGSSIGLGSSE